MRLDVISPHRALLTERIAPQWRGPMLRLSLVAIALLTIFSADWARMVSLWWNASTYNHILLVPFIIGWLVWTRSGELQKLTPRTWWPGLVAFAIATFVWLLGDVSGLATASQLGAVAMLQASVITLLGPRVAWALVFPLVYALFLVPVGDELVPALQMITAKITTALTEMSGIPAVIDGVFIDTPAGLFEVAEACSGVKFLIAMVALGSLIAHVCFSSWKRRVVFMAVAIALPIVANGIRAWGTIYIAQSQGIAFAAGFDHIFYGWIFFALVMAALLALGWKWFDRSVDEVFIDGECIAGNPLFNRLEKFRAKGWQMVAGIGLVIALALLWSAQSRALEAELPDQIAFPPINGWEETPHDQAYPWLPHATGSDQKLIGSFQDADGRVVDVVYALYASQAEGREASAFGEGALPFNTEWRWLETSTASDGTAIERMQAIGRHRRVTQTFYRVGDWFGGGKLALKIRTMKDKLLLRSIPTTLLIVSAEEGRGFDAAKAVADFRSSISDTGEWMDRTGGLD